MFDSKYLSKIKTFFQKVAKVFFTKDVATFLFFLALSFLFWLMHNVGAHKQLHIKTAITYSGIPSNVLLNDSLPNLLSYVIEDNTSDFWRYKRKLTDTLNIDLSDYFNGSGKFSYSTKNLVSRIMAAYGANAQLIKLDPAKINAQYTLLRSKQVPLILKSPVELTSQYLLKEPVRFSPASILVYATPDALDSIKALYVTVPGTWGKSADVTCPLPKLKDVKFPLDYVHANVSVEMSTEKQLSIPIVAEHLPKDLSFKAFPSTVNVVFAVGLSKYESIVPAQFKAVVNYDSISNDIDSTAHVFLIQQPHDIYNVRLSPKNVEFILEKK